MAAARLLPVLVLVLAWSLGSQAGTVRESEVRYEHGIYHVEMAMEVEAAIEDVRPIITDYAGLERISNLLTKTTLMEAPGEDGIRRRLETRLCVLIFCYEAVMVEDVEEIGSHTVLTTVVPALSDFRSGHSRWEMRALTANRSLIRFRYEMEPDFWIPPLIGPLLIKRKLLREAGNTIEKIEALAIAEE